MGAGWTQQEDGEQAGGTRVSAEGTHLVYRLAVQPLPIYRKPPTIGLLIHAEIVGDRIEPVSLAHMRWKEA